MSTGERQAPPDRACSSRWLEVRRRAIEARAHRPTWRWSPRIRLRCSSVGLGWRRDVPNDIPADVRPGRMVLRPRQLRIGHRGNGGMLANADLALRSTCRHGGVVSGDGSTLLGQGAPDPGGRSPLPPCTGSVTVVALINMFWFGMEVALVVIRGRCVAWVSTNGDQTLTTSCPPTCWNVARNLVRHHFPGRLGRGLPHAGSRRADDSPSADAESRASGATTRRPL